jgi:hypothetical protein
VPVAYRAPLGAARHLVADLAPSASYAVAAAPEATACKVSLTPGAGKTASAQGILVLDVTGCAPH